MKSVLKDFIVGTPFESVARFLLRRPAPPAFENTGQYWDVRYRSKGSSGAGSYGRLAAFKAGILNAFVETNDIRTVIEFGCGDGNQLRLANYDDYIGVDISQRAVDMCRATFSEDRAKHFLHSSDYAGQRAELSTSLDVVYHLVEDSTFEAYMNDLFDAGERYVIIYSCDFDEPVTRATHVRPRKFTDWVEARRPEFELVERIPNRYPAGLDDGGDTSFADFYIFRRRAAFASM